MTGRITEAVAGFLTAEGWPCEDDGEGVVRTSAGQGEERWLVYAVADEQAQHLVVYSLCPFTVPDMTRAAVAEALTRANHGLVLGAFEMDLDTGEVRFRTGLPCEDVELTAALLRPTFEVNALAMGRYLPAIDAVALHEEDPIRAVAMVEG